MNILNTFKKSKHITLAVVFSLGAVFSVNAAPMAVAQINETNIISDSAQNIESTISTFLLAQGKVVVAELSAELEKSISSSINEFSLDLFIDESLAWLTEDEATSSSAKVVEKNEKTSDCVDAQ